MKTSDHHTSARHHVTFLQRSAAPSRIAAARSLAGTHWSRGLRSALALAAIATLAACHRADHEAPAPREVVVLRAQSGAQGATLVLPAEVQARYVTPLSFRVAGLLLERRVHLGDAVHQGEIVARLDPADAERNAASAKADWVAARERLSNAQQQLQRDTLQAHENLISALQLEQTQDAFAAAESQAKDAEQRAGLAANQLGYTDLPAPHDGVISAEQADTGQVVSAGQSVFSLAWSGATDITTEVAEAQIGTVHPGAAASVTLAALPQHVLHGTVREVSPAADPQSRTFHVKVTLDTQDPALRLGMTGEVTIDLTGAPQGDRMNLVIPATALFHQGNQPAVWLVDSNARLVLRPVTVSAYGERTVTLTGGIAAGDTIVVQGVHTLTAGETVKAIAPLHAEDFAS